MAKAGIVEALYIGECIGIMLIWLGDRVCSVPDSVPLMSGIMNQSPLRTTQVVIER